MLKRLSLLCPAHLDIVPHHEFSVLSPLLTCLSVPSTAPVRSCSTLSPSSVSSVLSSPRMPKARLALGSATWSRHITSRWRSPSWRSATLTELPVWPGRQRGALSLVRISRDTAKCKKGSTRGAGVSNIMIFFSVHDHLSLSKCLYMNLGHNIGPRVHHSAGRSCRAAPRSMRK